MYTFTKADFARTQMSAPRTLALGTALMATIAVSSAAPTVYVSTAGSDTYDGSSATKTTGIHGPVASLARARTVALQLRTHDASSTITISIAPGNYYMASSLKLQAGDSNMSYVASGSGVRLIGGLPVNTWRTVTTSSILSRMTAAARANVRVADLKANAVKQFGSLLPRGWFTMVNNPAPLELYGLGVPMKMASYPNTGWIPITGGNASGNVQFSSAFARRYSSISGAMAVGYFAYDWADFTMPVQSYSGGTSMTIQAPPYGVTAGGRFRIMNVLEELDQPGEYYIDRSKGLAYYWPSVALNRDAVMASMLEDPIIKIELASGITLKGFSLEASRGRGIDANGSSNIMVDGLTVKGLGREGISVVKCTNSTIQNCVVNDTGSSAIEISGGDSATLTPSGNIVRNNTINRAARIERAYRPAIMVRGVGNTVSANTIKNMPHEAIQIYGNDHIVEYNLIDGACQETGDSGAIYSGRDITFQGNVIRYNLVKNVVPTVVRANFFEGLAAVYIDDCAGGFNVYGNIFDNVYYGVLIGGGRNNTVSQNVFYRTTYDISMDGRGKTWAANMFAAGGAAAQQVAALGASLNLYRARYPGFAAGLDSGDYGLPVGNSVSTNIMSVASSIKYSDLAYTQPLLSVVNNLIGSSALLNNPGAGDYSLKTGVNAGFTPPTASQIGALSVSSTAN